MTGKPVSGTNIFLLPPKLVHFHCIAIINMHMYNYARNVIQQMISSRSHYNHQVNDFQLVE